MELERNRPDFFPCGRYPSPELFSKSLRRLALELTAQTLFEFLDGVFLQSNFPVRTGFNLQA